jgi:hypothetical protein
MGEWSTISYLRTANVDHADDVVARLCATEGYTPVSAQPRSIAPAESRTTWPGTPDTEPSWTFVLVPGAGEWTMLVTLPFGLLGTRRPGASRMRLADLAVLAGRDAFTFELFDGTAWVLAEADAHGQTAFSGFPLDDEWFYHDEPLSEDHAKVGFRLLGVPEPLRRAAGCGLLSFVEIGELLVGCRYPDEFGSDGRRWDRQWLWYNGIQTELQDGRDIPVPDARVRHFTASR